jgi:ABC-2 type transport system permease protein
MAVFRAALYNEIEKLSKKKKVTVAVIISLLAIVIGQIVVVGVRSGIGMRGAGSADFPLLVLSVVIYTILPLFTALVAIESFAGEYAQNSIRVTLTRPVSRLKIYTAKVVAIGVFILANLLILLIFSLLAGFIFNSNSANVWQVGQIFLAYIVSFIPMFVLALGIALLANVLRNGISTFFISILIFLAFKVLEIFFSSYSGLFLTNNLGWYNLWLANTFPLAKIMREFLIMAGYGIMFFTAGFYLFDQKEF